MNIEITQDRFVKGIHSVSRAAGKNLSLPVLGCVLLSGEKNVLVLRATNVELGIEVRIPAKVIEPGSVAVPVETLQAFASNAFGAKQTSLLLKNSVLTITTEHSTSSVKTVPSEDFPTLPTIEKGASSFSVPASEFVRGLRSVWWSASVSSIKPELGSVLVSLSEEGLCFVATDSFRLAEKKLSVRGLRESGDILIPLKSVGDIIKLLDDEGGEVDVAFTKNQISFSAGAAYLTSRLVDASFPDYRQIIPKASKTKAILLKQDFINALKLAAVFSDQYHHVRLSVDPGKEALSVAAESASAGETTNKIQAKVSGEEVSLSFNHRYLADCLTSIASDSIVLTFSGAGKPVLLSGVADESFLYLVMPMNR